MNIIEKLQKKGITLDYKQIQAICQKYYIQEFSVFGSSLREDFNEQSDIDILVSFRENADITLFDIIDLENELTIILERKADVVEKESLKNPIRKKNILETREIIYAA